MVLDVLRGDSQDYQAIQQLLRELRSSAGLRQQDLAERLSVPQSLVSKVETGERRLDMIETEAFCRAIGVTLQDFVSRLAEKRGTGA